MSRIEELENLKDSSPDDPFIQYALAREYEKQSAIMQAILMYEHLVIHHPDYVATYYPYSKMLYNAGNRNAAIELMRKGIETGVRNKESHAVAEMQALLNQWIEEDE